MTLIPIPDVNTQLSYPSAGPRERLSQHFFHSNNLANETAPKRHSYHMPLGIPTADEWLPKCMENEGSTLQSER